MESVSVECEQAEVGGFGSPMNPLSQNAAESNAPRARAGLRKRVPVPPGQAGHGARELCCRLRPLVCLPNAPSAAAAATAAASPPDAANYWPWSLEKGGESRSCRDGLRQALANQSTAQRAPELGRGQGAGAVVGRGQPETYTLAGPSSTPARRAQEGVRGDQTGRPDRGKRAGWRGAS